MYFWSLLKLQTSHRELQTGHKRVIDDYRHVTEDYRQVTDNYRRVTNGYRQVLCYSLIFANFRNLQTAAGIPTNIFLFKFNKRNTRKKCEIRSNLTRKASKRYNWTCSTHSSGVSIVDFELVNACCIFSRTHKVDARPKLKVNMTFP